MEKKIITITQPIDPADMGDDGSLAGAVSGPADPARVVTDVTRDPRGGSFQEQQPSGVQVVARQPNEPLVAPGPKSAAVRQLRGADHVPTPKEQQDAELSEFVSSLGMDPTEMGLEHAEIAPRATEVEAVATRTPPAQVGHPDALQRALNRALDTLGCLPPGTELFIGTDEGLGQDGVELVMGVGLLIGKGLAAYRGEGHYRITDKGRSARGQRR